MELPSKAELPTRLPINRVMPQEKLQKPETRIKTEDPTGNWELKRLHTSPKPPESKPIRSKLIFSFTKQDPGVQPQDPNLKANLRASHFKFDDVKTNQFKSMSSQSYVPKKGEPGVLNEELKKDLRSHHFTYGTSNGLMMSSTQLAFRNTNGAPSSLDPNLARELRTHHFSLGQGGWQPSTKSEYRNEFPWQVNHDV
jgi:hypothetical protein